MSLQRYVNILIAMTNNELWFSGIFCDALSDVRLCLPGWRCRHHVYCAAQSILQTIPARKSRSNETFVLEPLFGLNATKPEANSLKNALEVVI